MARIFAIVFAFAISLHAQGERSAIGGTVTDPSGSAIPNASVIATHVETNIETRATTTDAGVYRMPYMSLGTYRITASASGFKTAAIQNVTLRVAQTLNIDVTLELGQVTEQVTVSAEAAQLDSSSAEIGRYVTNAEFDTWPLPVSDGHRQLQSFIFRSLPGATGNEFQGSINGGQYYSHEILIEGLPLGRMDLQGGSNNEFSPSAEAVSEFKLQTGTMSAQYGGGQTSVANFAIKSGTNDLHGTVFSYVQNDVLRANSASNNANGRPRPPYKEFNGGYSVGGPVYLPKIYNGRNRTFFFHNFEWDRRRDFTSGTTFATLPTVEMKRGDFSRLFDPAYVGRTAAGTVIGTDPLGRAIRAGQIYDPATTRLVDGVTVRDPFPGNIIPQSRFSPVSQKILEVGIDNPLTDTLLQNMPTLASGQPVFDERISGYKVDHHLNEKLRLSAFYNHHYRNRNNSPGDRWGNPPGLPTGVYQKQYTPGRLARAAFDWTISPTVLNHIAIGYNRFGNTNQSVFVDEDWPAKLGMKNVPGTHFPALIFTGQQHLGGRIGANDGSNRGRLGSANAGASYHGSTVIADDMTIIRGAHNFRTGFELRKYYYNDRSRGTESGRYEFNSLQTQFPGFTGCSTCADNTGHAFASFLLGAASASNRNVVASFFGWRSSTPAFYFQDDWKLTRKLTLNLGLRWEIVGPLNEVAGRMSGLDPKAPNPGAGNRPGALVFVDDFGRKSFHDRYWKQFSPRVGFAHATTHWLVVRGGYGINNTPLISNGFGFPGTLGFNGSINVNTSTVSLQFPQDPVYYLHNAYPNFAGVLPNKNPALANGTTIDYVAPDSNRLPYVQNWNLGFQVQLPSAIVFEAAYIGNKGTRLLSPRLDNMNQNPVDVLRFGDALIQRAADRPDVVALPYPGFSGTVAQALRPFPQFLDVNQRFSNFGSSLYNSLQLTLTRHFSRSFGMLVAYTFSKALATTDDPGVESLALPQDVYNRGLSRSTAIYNVPQYLKLTWIYELPIGSSRAVDLGKVGNALVGGWRLTGIHNYRSGNALGISDSGISTNALFSPTIRPDWVTGVPTVIDTGQPVNFGRAGAAYLNPAAFARVPRTSNNVPLRLGTAPRVLPNVRGPHQFSEDLGLEKKFRFTEQMDIEVRADFINAFNRSGRGDPVTDVTSPLFGQITGFQRGPRNIQLGARFTF